MLPGRLKGFCRGQQGFSQVFSEVGGQTQPIGVGCPKYAGGGIINNQLQKTMVGPQKYLLTVSDYSYRHRTMFERMPIPATRPTSWHSPVRAFLCAYEQGNTKRQDTKS